MPVALRRSLTLVLFSTALQVLIFPMTGPLPVWRAWLAWAAFVPLLIAMFEESAGARAFARCTLLAYLSGVLWYVGTCYWVYPAMHVYGGISAPVSAFIVLLFALYLGLYHAAFGALCVGLFRILPKWAAWLMLPCTWVAVELARARITSFPWDLLGYSQVDNLFLTRLAPLTGVYGISFVVMAVNCGFAAAVLSRGRRRQVILGIASAVTLACLISGFLSHPPAEPTSQTAVLLQPDLTPGVDDRRTSPSAMLAEFAEISLHPANHGAGMPAVVLWPESPAPFETNRPEFTADLSLLAVDERATVIAGAVGADLDQHAPNGYHVYNSAAVFSPGRGLVGRYDKIHLVPFGEFVPYADLFAFARGLTEAVGMFDRGKVRSSILSDGHRYGIFLCYESIFGDEVRAFVEGGAQVLVNLSDDGWYGDTSAPFQHLNMARMRAIENHRWLLRDTNTGVTASIDPYGRIVATTARHQRTAIAVPFSFEDGTTFYTRHGDVFAYACALLTAGALVSAMMRSSASPEQIEWTHVE